MEEIKNMIQLEAFLEARREQLIEATEQHDTEYWKGCYEGQLSLVVELLLRIRMGGKQ